MMHDAIGLAHQNEEGRLEGVLDVLRMAQQTLTDSQHQSPMPPHEQLEGCLVVTLHPAAEQFSIGRRVRAGRLHCMSQPTDQRGKGPAVHVGPPHRRTSHKRAAPGHPFHDLFARPDQTGRWPLSRADWPRRNTSQSISWSESDSSLC